MTKQHFPEGLDGRQRDQNPPKAGEIRAKRGDTLVRTLREEYGPGFAPAGYSVSWWHALPRDQDYLVSTFKCNT